MRPAQATTRQFCPSGHRIRARLARKHCLRATENDAAVPETKEERIQRFKEQFSSARSLDAVTAAAAGLAAPVFYGVTAIAAAGAGLVGYAAANQAPLEGTAATAARAGAAAAGAGAVVAGGSVVARKRSAAAGVELWNHIAEAEDPTVVDPSVAESLRSRFGGDPKALESIKQAYAGFLQVLIPPGATPLLGDEPARCRAFLDAVGLPDEEAALVHLDVGRTFYRQRLEVADVEEAAAGARAFQKLVYVSSLVFGEMRSGFLTPWVARFGVTPEQVAIAKRDAGSALLVTRLQRDYGGQVPSDAAGLQALRETQKELGITDEAAAAQLATVRGREVEATLEAAVESVKARGAAATAAEAVAAVDKLLAQRRGGVEVYAAARAAAEAGAESAEEATEKLTVIPGLPPLSVAGTKFAATTAKNDLLDVYKRYMAAKVEAAETAVPPQLAADLQEVAAMLELPAGKAADAREAQVAEAYEALLRGAVTEGRLDSAESPAQVLNELITRVGMPGEAALAMHKDMYQIKLREVLAGGKLSDDGAAALERTARLLCLKADDVTEMNGALKGEVLARSLRKALETGVDRFSSTLSEEVRGVVSDLRMEGEEAFKALQGMARNELAKRINDARNKGNRLDNARALRQVVYYNQRILSPLVAVTKGLDVEERKEGAMKEMADMMAKARAKADAEEKAAAEASGDETDSVVSVDGQKVDDLQSAEEAAADAAEDKVEEAQELPADTPASLAKAQRGAEKQEGEETMTTAEGKEVKLSPQKDITVAEDFGLEERVGIYKTYLMFCMTGDVVQLPMGGQMVMERDEAEFGRLSQLGDVLGLGPMDVYKVHNEMAEEAFKAQAEQMAPGGVLSEAGAGELKEMAEKMGIGEERAQKIVRGVTNKRLVGNLESLKAQGELTLEKVLELKEQDIEVSTILPDTMRMSLYEAHVTKVLSEGAGAGLDAEHLLKKLPEDLELDVEKASSRAGTAARGKARSVLVQAFAYYRTKSYDDAVKYVNNLVACVNVATAGGGGTVDDAKWDVKEELLDLYGLYCSKTPDAGERATAAGVLGLAEAEARDIEEAVASGNFKIGSSGTDTVQSGSRSIF